MPDPSTSRLGLYKSKSDGSELVDYSQDIGQNLDKLDAAAGFASCTSSTRPSSPYSGKPIFETDTSYRTFFSNGTTPASGSWVEIPNSSAQYNSTLRLAPSKQINVGGSASAATIAVANTATTTDLLSARVTGDTQDRFEIETDGTHNWGPGGSTAPDTNLYRSAANTLRTGDNLVVDLALTVTGNINSAANLTMGAWTSWTPTWSTTTGTHLPSYGNATIDCKWARVGRTIMYYLNINFGSTTNFGSGATGSDNWTFTLPVTAATPGAPCGKASLEAGSTVRATSAMAQIDSGATALLLYVDSMRVDGGTTAGGIVDSVSPFTWASGMRFQVVGQYEAAS